MGAFSGLMKVIDCNNARWKHEINSLRMLENRVQRKIFEVKREEVTGDWKKLRNKEAKLHERELCESYF